MYSGEDKYINFETWEDRLLNADVEYIQQFLREIDEDLVDCENIVRNSGAGGLNYSSKRDRITELLYTYVDLIHYVSEIKKDIRNNLDDPFFERINNKEGPTENLSRIHIEDVAVPSIVNGKSVNLTIKDFMTDEYAEVKEFEVFHKLYKKDYEEIKKSGGFKEESDIEDFEDYLDYIVEMGEFDHKVDQPFANFVSGLLDLTIIKPIIEAISGYDMVTGEDLTGMERAFKVGGAVIDTFTLGSAFVLSKASKGAMPLARILAVEAGTNFAAYTAGTFASAADMPLPITLLLSMGAGITVSKIGLKYTFKSKAGTILGILDEADFKNIDERLILKNSEVYLRYKKAISGHPNKAAVDEILLDILHRQKYANTDIVLDAGMVEKLLKSIPEAQLDDAAKNAIKAEILYDFIIANGDKITTAQVDELLKGAGKAKFATGYYTHLIDVEDVISKGGKGVVGGHNLNNFYKAFTDRGWSIDDCVISKTPHPSIPGLYEIEYQIPAMKYGPNGDLIPIPNKFKKIAQPKTVYDTSKISNSQMLVWGRQAMEEGLNANRIIINTNPKVLTNTLEGYVTINGVKLKFVGYPLKTTGEIKNFYLVFN